MKISINQLMDVVKDHLQTRTEIQVDAHMVDLARASEQAKSPFQVKRSEILERVCSSVDCSAEEDVEKDRVIFRKRDACR
jgi:hypothetical protein